MLKRILLSLRYFFNYLEISQLSVFKGLSQISSGARTVSKII